jgi:hypothetical protein
MSSGSNKGCYFMNFSKWQGFTISGLMPESPLHLLCWCIFAFVAVKLWFPMIFMFHQILSVLVFKCLHSVLRHNFWWIVNGEVSWTFSLVLQKTTLPACQQWLICLCDFFRVRFCGLSLVAKISLRIWSEAALMPYCFIRRLLCFPYCPRTVWWQCWGRRERGTLRSMGGDWGGGVKISPIASLINPHLHDLKDDWVLMSWWGTQLPC